MRVRQSHLPILLPKSISKSKSTRKIGPTAIQTNLKYEQRGPGQFVFVAIYVQVTRLVCIDVKKEFDISS
jgi:hypothetical protein